MWLTRFIDPPLQNIFFHYHLYKCNYGYLFATKTVINFSLKRTISKNICFILPILFCIYSSTHKKIAEKIYQRGTNSFKQTNFYSWAIQVLFSFAVSKINNHQMFVVFSVLIKTICIIRTLFFCLQATTKMLIKFCNNLHSLFNISDSLNSTNNYIEFLM